MIEGNDKYTKGYTSGNYFGVVHFFVGLKFVQLHGLSPTWDVFRIARGIPVEIWIKLRIVNRPWLGQE